MRSNTGSVATINLTKFIFQIFSVALILLFSATSVFSQAASPAPSGSPAQDPNQSTEINLTYPVDDLGGCNNLEECTDYCEDPVNYNSCSNFAKKNGFYRDDITAYASDEDWEGTQNELGCNSKDSCSDFCSKSENYDACESYAKRHEIPGGYIQQPDKPEYLEVAKNVLGCDSTDSCANACDDPANADKCTDFANQVGLLGGTTTEGPGGCQTPGTCGAYCADPNNYIQCSNFVPEGTTFSGPGGCDSQESCRSYCEQNPDSCRSYSPGSNGAYTPIACPQGEYHGPGGACTSVGNTQTAVSCIGADKYWDGTACHDQPPVGISTEIPSSFFEPRSDMGNCQTPGECYDYCKENPNAQSCQGFDPQYPRPEVGDGYTPYLYYTPGSEVEHEPVEDMGGCTSPADCYDYCTENPGECEGFNENAPRPPEVYIPGTYYTPPADEVYVTPPITNFYTTPMYYTPPEGSTYTTPQYYTPWTGGGYTTPVYYTPPTYTTPTYYTPPDGSNYTTPNYYTPPPPYTTPRYYTPGTYPTPPQYSTPPAYTSPSYGYPTPGGAYTSPTYNTPANYSTPTYYTPPPYSTPYYYTPYTTPNYYTPGDPNYSTPSYYTPYTTPNYSTPTYYSPAYYSPGGTYTSPYYTPGSGYTSPSIDYSTPGTYYSPYNSPNYYYPTPSTSTYYSPSDSNYSTPSNTYYVSPSYSYPTPGGSDQSPVYGYPTPGSGYTYPTPNTYYYPTPTGSYASPGDYPYPTPSYPTPSESYGTPPYGTPSYDTPPYGTPSYDTPSYGTPSYGTPSYDTPSYGTPSSGGTLGVSTSKGIIQQIWDFLTN
ncbi:MAG: hypothetical protein US19_C0014G0016 [Candidatus Daviesbacteria bacterium GW2011_GWB1_36_5]|uniref:Uncharacterized protein n=1 Tax=Candidatus Daviesbacteria bacterium GW2011_GWB1_36_5 TaxID=1618426 RepID=A0A0G0HBG9_9BACT|nr:MAG: hypothetical protein US19_C0014G0016 [Candidatus Daviesbacteria bacterium GW2011_GWB1_36_5]